MFLSHTFKDDGVFFKISVVFFVIFVTVNVTAKAYHLTGAEIIDDHSPVTTNPLLPQRTKCGESLDDKIFGGNVTALTDFPWLVLLEYLKDNGEKVYLCGGSLISNQYILTAAHCLVGPPGRFRPKLITIRLGEWDLETETDCEEGACSDPPQDIGVESFLVHEDYNRAVVNGPYDIGLVRMERPVEYTYYISPICLPLIDEEVVKKSYVGQELVVAGWGKTETASHSTKKLKVSVPVVPCSDKFKSNKVKLIDNQFCAGGEKGKDSCNGDSGGPIMAREIKDEQVNWFATGLVSFGPLMCGTEDIPGVYTDVSKFGQWISDNVKP